MSTPLEDYLASVESCLKPMPNRRRAAELRELRAHLEQSVGGYQEQGQSRLEAEHSAIEQFGAAEDVSKSLLWAYRKRRISRFQAIGAAIVTVLGSAILLPVAAIIGQLFLGGSDIAYMLLSCAIFAAMGAAIGYLFPYGAVVGTTVGVAVLVIDASVQLSMSKILSSTIGLRAWEYGLALLTLLVAVGAAWVVSRWRLARMMRAQPA